MKFPLIYLDPPWRYQNWTDAKNGAAKSSFRCEKHKTMLAWNIGALAADDSLMFMWATFPKLPEALDLLGAWGFRFVGVPFVWVKTNKDGLNLAHGPGFWTAAGAEIVLLGRRGKGLPRHRETRGHVKQVQLYEEAELFTGPAIKPHSRKPLEIVDRIEELVGPGVAPKLEMFARRVEGQPLPHLERHDWHATGLEWDGRTVEEAIEHFAEWRE